MERLASDKFLEVHDSSVMVWGAPCDPYIAYAPIIQ
jgi:hypothetical protein